MVLVHPRPQVLVLPRCGHRGPHPLEAVDQQVRLPAPLVYKLRAHLAQEDWDSTAPAFPNIEGEVIDPNNLRRRVLKPLVEEAGAPWAVAGRSTKVGVGEEPMVMSTSSPVAC